MFVHNTVTVRFLYSYIRPTKFGHTLTTFERISNVLVPYQERIDVAFIQRSLNELIAYEIDGVL